MPSRPKTHRPTRPTDARVNQAAPRKASAARRGYGYAWRRARLLFLAEHPLCVECAKEGRPVGAVDVDHITPHRGDPRLFWDRANWQPLCHRCHARKTARFDKPAARNA